MLPAARPRICSLLRQTAGEGPRVVGQTLASAQSHPPEPPHWAPTALRPRSPSSAKPTELEGFRTAAECDTPAAGVVWWWLCPVAPMAMASGQFLMLIDDPGHLPGDSEKQQEAARRIAPCSTCPLMGCNRHRPCQATHQLGRALAPYLAQSIPHSRCAVAPGVEQQPPDQLHPTTAVAMTPGHEPALPAAASSPALAAAG